MGGKKMKYKKLYKLYIELDDLVSNRGDIPHCMSNDFCGAYCDTHLLFELLENPMKKCRETMETTLNDYQELVDNGKITDKEIINFIIKYKKLSND